MDAKLIERLERRVQGCALEISCECDDIVEALEKLAQLPGLPPTASALVQEILEATATIDDEATEITGTLAWFKDRMASGGMKNG
jgi:hypothetical protein